MADGRLIHCRDCPNELAVDRPARLKHHPDGSHTVVYLETAKPRPVIDPKPRGRRRA